MNSLNELFEQILHSEENCSKRINRLRELGSLLQQNQQELQRVRGLSEALQGELVLKNQKLADCEISRRLQEVRKAVLEEQRAQLAKEKQQLTEDLEKSQSNAEHQREDFVSEVNEFNQSYDLTGAGVRYREQQAKRKVTILKEELKLLETEFSEIQLQQEEVAKLDKQLLSANKQLEEKKSQQNKLKVLLQDLQAEVTSLEEEKANSTAKFNKEDSEFTRLQRELETCRNSPEEAECRRLTKDLEDLQRISYQKQMKYHTYPQGMKRTPDGTVFQPLQHQHTPSSGNPQIIQVVKKSMPSQVHCNTNTREADGRRWRNREINQCENAVTISSPKGVLDDEWFTEEDECEDWELQALAEVSELTALDLDDNDSDELTEEVGDIICHDSVRRDTTLARNFVTNKEGDGMPKQGPHQGQTGHPTPGYSANSSSLALRAFPPVTTRSVSVGYTTGQLPPKKSRIQQSSSSSAPAPLSSHLHPAILPAAVADSSACSNPLRKRPGQFIYKPPGQQQQQVTTLATAAGVKLPKSAKRVRFHY